MEGAHLVPGFVDVAPWQERVLAVELVVTVEDEDVHRGHFAARAADAASRPFDRYMKGFRNIRRVQKYIKSQALSHGVPVVPNYNLDQAIAAVVDLVMERATERVGRAKGTDDSPTADEPERDRGRDPMRLFLDTANIDEIREINRWGVLPGVTTNPSLLAREMGDVEKAWRLILEEVCQGDVSLETTEPEAEAMYEQGKHLASLGAERRREGPDDPRRPHGRQAAHRATGIRINVTLVFSPAQAILAAEIGAYIVSPFLGRHRRRRRGRDARAQADLRHL